MEPPLWRLRRAAKILFKGSLLLVPASSYVAYKYRPRSSTDTEYHESLFTIERQPTNAVEQFLYACARQFAVVLTSNAMYHLLKSTQRVDMDDIEKLHRYIDNDRDGVPLVTIANHASCLDDPGVASLILPLKVRTDARLLRWTVCTEELCFDHPAVASFFGAGKAVPIQRGGSLYQKGLATLQNKLNQGHWVHLYAEGRVWQEQGLPLRDELGRWCSGSGRCGEPWTKVGPLKWGVGKLIANSAKLPVIVPFYHAGMHDIMPQNRENQLIHAMPLFGNDALITLRVGDPVSVTDLLDAYHVAARQRAVARNQRRIDEYRAELRRQGFSVAQVAGLLAPFEELQSRWVAAAQAQGARALAAADAAASAAAATAGAGEEPGLVSWLLGLVGLGGPTAPAASHASAAAAAAGAAGGPTPAGSAAAHRPAIADPALNPRNTVEEASDHTGSSARIAGMARPLSPADAAAAAAAAAAQGRGAECETGQNWPTLRPIEAVAVEGAHKLGAVARETAAELEERVAASAREIEGQAAELMKRLRELRGEHDAAHPPRAPLPGPHHPHHPGGSGAAGAPAPAPVPSTAAGDAAAAAAPAAGGPSSIHRLTAVAKEVMHDVSSATHDVMHDASQRAKGVMHDVMQDMAKTVEGAVEEATGRWRASVSVPAPPAHRIPSPQRQQEAAAAKAASAAAAAAGDAPAPAASAGPSAVAASEGAADAAAGAAAHVAATSVAGAAPSGPRRRPAAGLGGDDGSSGASSGSQRGEEATAGSATAAGPPFALSDEPVMELIPTRTLRTGAVVPQFIEAPLRIKPPDHTFLTPAEATLEEDYRLQLYSDIASRLEGALAVLERRVMARRREQGHEESRPMETASQRFGPAWAPPTLPGVPRDGESEALQGAFAGTGAPVDTTGSPVIRALRRVLGRGPPSEPAPAQSTSAAAADSAAAAAPSNTTQLR